MQSHALPRTFRFPVVAVLLAPFWAGPSAARAAPPSESRTTLHTFPAWSITVLEIEAR
jgi:hypothetical protein